MGNINYAGFWIRLLAALIDTVLMMVIIIPLVLLIAPTNYGIDQGLSFWGFIANYVLPAIAVILFWVYKSATPGKMVLKLKIVDASSGQTASTGQLIGRYFAYYVSVIPLMLGIIWVGIDKRKQGWHDKLAGTIVIRQV